jgi:hypothetical protein
MDAAHSHSVFQLFGQLQNAQQASLLDASRKRFVQLGLAQSIE